MWCNVIIVLCFFILGDFNYYFIQQICVYYITFLILVRLTLVTLKATWINEWMNVAHLVGGTSCGGGREVGGSGHRRRRWSAVCDVTGILARRFAAVACAQLARVWRVVPHEVALQAQRTCWRHRLPWQPLVLSPSGD